MTAGDPGQATGREVRLRRSSKGKREGGQSKAGENQTEENKHPTKPSHNKLLPLERALQTTLKRPERNMYAAAHINGTSK